MEVELARLAQENDSKILLFVMDGLGRLRNASSSASSYVTGVAMTRYAMNVRDMVPWWVPYSAIAFIILVCASILISTAIALDPWGLFVAPLALYGIWFTHWFFKGMSDPVRNYVELSGDRLVVHRWLPTWFGHSRAGFRLQEIAGIEPHASHSWMTFSYFPWLGAMQRPHIDIHFKGAQIRGLEKRP